MMSSAAEGGVAVKLRVGRTLGTVCSTVGAEDGIDELSDGAAGGEVVASRTAVGLRVLTKDGNTLRTPPRPLRPLDEGCEENGVLAKENGSEEEEVVVVEEEESAGEAKAWRFPKRPDWEKKGPFEDPWKGFCCCTVRSSSKVVDEEEFTPTRVGDDDDDDEGFETAGEGVGWADEAAVAERDKGTGTGLPKISTDWPVWELASCTGSEDSPKGGNSTAAATVGTTAVGREAGAGSGWKGLAGGSLLGEVAKETCNEAEPTVLGGMAAGALVAGEEVEGRKKF